MQNTSRRQFVKMTGLASGAACLTNERAVAAQSRGKRPNLLYVFADQLRADALGYAGDAQAITPNFDRFAAQGINFTNATTVMPVCAAHRASLLTGKYPSSTGMVINELAMNPNHRSLGHVLTESGYNVGYLGKWHLIDATGRSIPRGPARLGFDGTWAAYNFHHQSYRAYYWQDQGDTEVRTPIEGHGPTQFTNLALDFLEEAAKGEQPFALVLSWNPPHDPWVKGNVPRENYDRFKDARFPLPPNFNETPDPYMDRYPGLAFRKEKGAWQWRRDFLEGGLEECLRCYYAMTNNLDEQFGRLLKKLDDLGLAEDTLVIFTSDHGEMFGSQGRMFKLTFYEEAARVPFLVRWPGHIPPGATSDACLNTPDIMPTLLGLMGLESPAEVEGMDLSPLCLGQPGPEPDAALLQGLGHTHLWIDGFEWRALRDKRFTYARYLRDGKELLFDRQRDPLQRHDLAAEPAYARELAHYRQALAQRLQELNDEFHPCTWYHDHWMYKDFSIAASAHGKFGPLPPVEPVRKRKG